MAATVAILAAASTGGLSVPQALGMTQLQDSFLIYEREVASGYEPGEVLEGVAIGTV